MAVQTSYNSPRAGVAGLLYDVSHTDVVARTNGDVSGAIQYGFGVVQGDAPGKNAALPTSASTVDQFEGVVLRGGPVERQFITDKTVIFDGQTLSVLKSGRVWVQLAEGEAPAYKQQAFLVTAGADAGRFAASGGVALNAYFDGAVDGDLAVVKLNEESFTQTTASEGDEDD
jgi:hypothetical protein